MSNMLTQFTFTPRYISQTPFESDCKIFILFVYQIVVANGEETVTANINQVIPAWNLNSKTKGTYVDIFI